MLVGPRYRTVSCVFLVTHDQLGLIFVPTDARGMRCMHLEGSKEGLRHVYSQVLAFTHTSTYQGLGV